jgi:hypothetical protein
MTEYRSQINTRQAKPKVSLVLYLNENIILIVYRPALIRP